MPSSAHPTDFVEAASVADPEFNAPQGLDPADPTSRGYGAKLEANQFAILWHPLIVAIAAAPDQNAAAEACVGNFAEMLPDHTVRFGWAVSEGANDDNAVPEPASHPKLHRLFDSRLGWLGNDNSVYQSLDIIFQKNETSSDRIRWSSANLVLEGIPPENDSASTTTDKMQSRLMIWIRPPQSDDDELKRFAAVIPSEVLSTIASVFFSRPVNGRWGKFVAAAKNWYSRRASLGIAALILIAVVCVPTRYRIDARASVTAMNARMVASPIDATLLIAHVRPGDQVKAGQPLLELDGRPLRIELEALSAEIEEATKDEDIALAGGEIAQAQLAGLRRQTLSRRRDLIVNQLDKLIVPSPIDGVVIQGDLQHSLGSPLEIGQTLLEIAPSDSVEIELEIPEVEIGYIEEATPVHLWFPAVGQTRFETNVTMVYPSATIREDENVFIAMTPMPTGEDSSGENANGELTVQAVSLHASDRLETLHASDRLETLSSAATTTPLRVGMQGEAVLLGPTRPWIWKWVRLPIRRLGWMFGW